MPGHVSTERLEAEVAAFPFVSQTAFRLGVTRLTGDQRSKELTDRLQHWLRLRSAGRSLETLTRIREWVWFAGAEPDVSLDDYVCTVARRTLRFVGDHVRVVEGVNGEYWRWLSLAMPSDMLVAALAAEHGRSVPTNHVTLGSDLLHRTLRNESVANIHLHLGAAFSFEELWSCLMSQIHRNESLQKVLAAEEPASCIGDQWEEDAEPEDDGRAGGEVGSVPFGSGRRYYSLLIRAAITRVLLGAYLMDQRGLDVPQFLRTVDEVCGWGPGDRSCATAAVFRDLAPTDAEEPPALLDVFRRVVRHLGPDLTAASEQRHENLSAVGRGDALRTWFPPNANVLPETQFLSAAIQRLRARPSAEFGEVFWRYVQFRGVVFRYLTAGAGTAGLDWFQRSYWRLASHSGGMADSRVESAILLESRGLETALGSLELRVAPGKIVAVASSIARHSASMEFALVASFVKGKHEHAEPSSSSWRFARYFKDQLKHAATLGTRLGSLPELAMVCRGVDVCANELATPTWVFAPLFSLLREAFDLAARKLNRPELRMRATMHVGEDFRTPLEGLRRVHEPIEFELIRDRDRLGHALVLSLDVHDLAATWPIMVQPREERLFDLLWELSHIGSERRRSIESEIRRLSNDVFKESPPSVDQLMQLRRDLHSPATLANIGFPAMRAATYSGGMPLLYRYLTDPGLYLRGQVPERVVMSRWEQRAIANAQRRVRDEVSEHGLTIEVNPSSNLIVGDLGQLGLHPHIRRASDAERRRERRRAALECTARRLRTSLPGSFIAWCGQRRNGCAATALRRAARLVCGEVPLRLGIGDDDPITFATCLGHEFAHVESVLAPNGESAGMAAIRRLIRDGWHARFSVPGGVEAFRDALCVNGGEVVLPRCREGGGGGH